MTTRTQDQKDTSTQAKLLARYLREQGLATLTHSQALEALAKSRNLKSHHIQASQDSETPAQAKASNADRGKALVQQALAAGLTFGETVSAFAAIQSPVEKLYARAAQDIGSEGELEVDDNCIVSLGDDKGAYVMSWSWMPQSELGLPRNPALALLMNYDSLWLAGSAAKSLRKRTAREVTVPLSDLEINVEAVQRYVELRLEDNTDWKGGDWRNARKLLPLDTWLVRTKPGAPEPFDLTVEIFETLHWVSDVDGYEGEGNGHIINLSFNED